MAREAIASAWPVRLEPLARIRDRLLAAPPLAPRPVALADARGAILAAPLRLPADLPAADEALRDGWAVAALDTVGASPYAPAVVPAHPVRAGAPLPPGCDAVVPASAAREFAGLVTVETAVAPGDEVRRRGFDGRAGTAIASGGYPLDATTLAVARLAGLRGVAVRRPRVRLDASGPLADLLAATVAAAGATVVPDAEPADLRLVATEAEVPAHPLARTALAEGRLLAGGLALTGAEAVAVAVIDAAPLLLIPARLDAVWLVAHALVAPLLARLAGCHGEAPAVTRPLARKIVSRVGFAELALLVPDEAGRWLPLATGALPAAALARAEAVVELPPESEGLPEGAPLAAHPPIRALRGALA